MHLADIFADVYIATPNPGLGRTMQERIDAIDLAF